MNPILQNRNYLYAYTIFWVLVTGAHFLFIHYILKTGAYLSFIDSLVYNLVYYPLGMAVWYVVHFNRMDTGKIFQLIMIHFVAALSLSLLWVFSSYNIVIGISHDHDFRLFQRSILPSRFLIGLLYYVIMCLVYYLIIYYQNLRDRIQKEAAINTMLKEAELNALKLQINPHFIFNSLNSVNSLILIQPGLAQEMIVKLSDFLRSTLSGNTKHMVTLKEEIDFSQLYLEIEKIRYGDKLHFNIHADNVSNTRVVPHMLIQPLLENAVKHGVQQSAGPVTIDLNIVEKDEFLTIAIKNNLESKSKAQGKKIGIRNISDRLTLIYNRSDLLQTSESENEFNVVIRIPPNQSIIHE